jgi:hypothetical protein
MEVVMTLKKLKSALKDSQAGKLLMRLPDHRQVPVSFHITEVGHVHKVFIDCGGTVRSRLTALLQVWVGSDEEHRLTIDKLSKILDKANSVIPQDDIPVEVEYEDSVISQYPVTDFEATPESFVLNLGLKHTDCLAKESCLPSENNRTSGCCSNPEQAPIRFTSNVA